MIGCDNPDCKIHILLYLDSYIYVHITELHILLSAQQTCTIQSINGVSSSSSFLVDTK